MPTLNGQFYRELRCKDCHKLILNEYIFAGRVAFNCPRCGELNELSFKHTPTKENTNIVKSEFTVHNDTQKGEN